MIATILLTVIFSVTLGASVLLHIKGKDGSGWGICAFFLLIAACNSAQRI